MGALGEAELAGIVIEHESGYRATRARPTALYGPELGLAWLVEYIPGQPPRPSSWVLRTARVVGLPTWPMDPPVIGQRTEEVVTIHIAGWATKR